MNAGVFTACERLLSATANGVYQGILVALLAGLTLRLFTRTNAATRYAVWFGVLLFVTALIPAHLLLSLQPHPADLTTASQPASTLTPTAPASAETRIADGVTSVETASPASPPDDSDAARLVGGAAPATSLRVDESADPDASAAGRPPGPVATGSAWRSLVAAILRPLSWSLEAAISLPHSICLGLVIAWILLASIRGGLIAGRIGEVRQVKLTSHAPSTGLQTLFDRLCDSLAARREVRLRISDTHRVAALLGFVHPVVLLPGEMDDGTNQGEAEHVLRHELAHVARRDDWGNLAQQLIQAGLFFHPAVWWISQRLSLEREIACDDHVLEVSGRPRDYALTLANVARRMSPRRHSLAPGVSNNHSQLQQRINMILNTNRDRSPRLALNRLGLLTSATAILAVLAIGAGPRLVLAQTAPEIKADSAPGNTAPATPEVVADAAPAVVVADQPEVEAGPKIKASVNIAPVVARVQFTPAVPEAPGAPAAPAVVADAPVPPTAPLPPAPPMARGRKRNASIEERLDRIERALEELEARDGGKVRHHGPGPDNAPMAFSFDFDARRMGDEAKRAAEAAQRAVEAGQREAQAGQREAEVAKREVERAMRDMAKLKNKDLEKMNEQLSEIEAEAPQRALEALRAAHESLERQMQALERQIKRLEQDRSHLKKSTKNHSEDADEDSKAEKHGEQAK